MPRLRGAVVALALLLASSTPALEPGDAHGIAVVAVDQLSPRQLNARVASEALGQPVDVRIPGRGGSCGSVRLATPWRLGGVRVNDVTC